MEYWKEHWVLNQEGIFVSSNPFLETFLLCDPEQVTTLFALVSSSIK